MGIRVTCNSCGKELNAKDDSAGKKVKCPGCGDVLAIPGDGFGGSSNLSTEKYGENPYASEGKSFDNEMKHKAAAADADMSTGDWVVAILCSGIGCIAGIIWMIQGKPKGSKMLGISLLMIVVWNVIRFGIAGLAPR